MTDYISRDAVNALIKAECSPKVAAYLIDAVATIPTADVRSVVLCKDCKWCHAGYCEKYDDLIPFGCANKSWEDWFCADGAMLKK